MAYLPRPFKAIVAELSAIKESLQKQENADRAAYTEAEAKWSEIPWSRIVSIILNTDDERCASHKEHSKDYGQQQKLVFWTRLAFWAAFCYAGFAAYQTVVIRLQLNEMAQQTDMQGVAARNARREAAVAQENSQKALQASIDQFSAEERPLVFVILNPAPLQPGRIQADINFVNYGKTPALRGLVWGQIFTGDDALKQADRWFGATPPKDRHPTYGLTVMPITQTPENVPYRSTLFSKEVVTKEKLAHYVSTDFTIVIAGRVSYYDFPGHWYYTDFCYSRFATGAIPACLKHNEIH